MFSASSDGGPYFEGVLAPKAVGGGLLFDVYLPDRDRLTWFSDGTEQGTEPLGSVVDGPSFSRDAVELAGAIYFGAERGIGEKLWRSDGTAEGTEVVIDIDPEWVNDFFGCPVCSPPGPPGPIFPRELTVLGENILFAAVTEQRGAELWRSDGTAEGTSLVSDLAAGAAWSEPTSLTRVGDQILFLTRGFPLGPFEQATEVWRSDGTASGTARLAELPDLTFSSPRFEAPSPTRIVDLAANGLFAVVHVPDSGASRLWISAGAAGLRELPLAGRVLEAVGASGRLFLAIGDLEEGSELWVSNSTFDGLERIVVRPGHRSAGVSELTPVAEGLVFAAEEGQSGHELWRLDLLGDGTLASAPYLLTEVRPGAASSSPTELFHDAAAPRPRLLFSAFDGTTGREPWMFELAPGPTEPLCVEDDVTVCIDDRFQMRAFFRTRPEAPEQAARAIGPALGSSAVGATRGFSFFGEDNLELAVKILDGQSLNDHHWFFYGALSDVEYRIEAVDLLTARRRDYVNEAGTLCGEGDIEAFPAAAFQLTGLTPGLPASPERFQPPGGANECAGSDHQLCLQDRFAVSASWRTADGQGTASAIPYSDESGSFWFFDQGNVELVVKILDGIPINGRYWLYYGGLSDVEYQISVIDTVSGQQRVYRNSAGTLCGGSDVELF